MHVSNPSDGYKYPYIFPNFLKLMYRPCFEVIENPRAQEFVQKLIKFGCPPMYNNAPYFSLERTKDRTCLVMIDGYFLTGEEFWKFKKERDYDPRTIEIIVWLQDNTDSEFIDQLSEDLETFFNFNIVSKIIIDRLKTVMFVDLPNGKSEDSTKVVDILCTIPEALKESVEEIRKNSFIQDKPQSL